MEPKALKELADELRGELKDIEDRIRCLRTSPVADERLEGETRAQTMLAVRHVEDARMRLGKVIQYGDGDGVSCFDK